MSEQTSVLREINTPVKWNSSLCRAVKDCLAWETRSALRKLITKDSLLSLCTSAGLSDHSPPAVAAVLSMSCDDCIEHIAEPDKL